ncbi:uncharacterized protein LOC121422492 [Lytechinus variegatus]|uniref:uncharacterized protein LOC121422492 n=1 Tax=Lytechinus variegatus TaxID=7654 RepID=UPI001BB2A095|nr:uncharacterized protein LOC121422492 [Lytechinus variegatus]
MPKSTSSVQPPVDYVHRGSWMIDQVEKITTDATATDVSGIEGADFHLSDTGDIFWSLPAGVTKTPYFALNFDLYEVIGAKFHAIKFIGSRSGDKIILFASQKSSNTLHLKYENEFIFHCEKVWKIEEAILEPFSLLRAFKEGFFTDMEIKADTGKTFGVHKIILKSTCPQLGWDMSPAPLTGTSEVVLSAIVHFLYTECLPDTIDEESARKILEVAGKLPGLERLANLCHLYLHNSDVKNQIINLVHDIHVCGDRLIQLFSPKTTTAEGALRQDNMMLEPSKFSYALRQCIKEGAVAGMKVVMICDLFNKRKREMTKQERHDLMKYIKSRLPIFVKQLYKFYEVFKEQLTQDITPKQNDDLARYLVPEMNKCLDITTDMVEQGKDALEIILRKMKAEENKKFSTKDYLKYIVVSAMFKKEMAQLKLAHERMCELFQSMLWRQEGFDCLSEADKMFSVNKNIEQIVEEFPVMLQKLEALDTNVNDGSMRDWKFNFKMGTSRVMWSFDKIITHRERFKPIVTHLNKLIGRQAFTDGLLHVGLLASATDVDEPSTSSAASPFPMDVDTEDAQDQNVSPLPVKRPLVSESLCVPPSAAESKLAKAMGALLESGLETDMCFEVITVTDEPSDVVVDHTQGEPIVTQETERKVIRHPPIYAHCAVIAARCDRFKRALLSGMRESIDKKIEVHDTDPDLFKQFLVFLYSGQINTSELTMDQVADMMSLSDRYEVDTLKHVCEASLKTKLNEDTVLYLLGLSDQFHAVTLRDATLAYIEKHPFIASSEIYDELPEHLQEEVKLRAKKGQEVGDIDPMAQFKGEQYDSSSTSSTEDGMKGIEESHDAMLDEVDEEKEMICIERLKEIIGEDIPHDKLVEIVRIADYDINRAANYYYSSI